MLVEVTFELIESILVVGFCSFRLAVFTVREAGAGVLLAVAGCCIGCDDGGSAVA